MLDERYPMERKDWFRWLRILGTGMLLVGVFLPWFGLGFEPQLTPIRWSGLEDILDSGSLGIESMLEYGLDYIRLSRCWKVLAALVYYFIFSTIFSLS